MNWKDLPIDEIRSTLRMEENPKRAFLKIIDLCKQKLPSKIWDEFVNMNIERDVQETQKWLRERLEEFPNFRGIYLGLDTLNMDNGNGSNLGIGLSSHCNPKEFSDEWAYECAYYGESHLIKSLYEVSNCFENNEKWTNEERNFSEYLIFLSYSGIVLREALKNLRIIKDYISIWGFHDGDMFFLIQKIGHIESIITEIDL